MLNFDDVSPRISHLAAKEILNFLGFPRNFILPKEMELKHLYKAPVDRLVLGEGEGLRGLGIGTNIFINSKKGNGEYTREKHL